MKPMVKIIDRAEIPSSKSKPKRSQIILIGTILGLFGGIFFSFFIEAIKKQTHAAK